MFTLDLFSVANAANAVQDQQKQKILEKAFFRDAGNSADCAFFNLHRKHSISL